MFSSMLFCLFQAFHGVAPSVGQGQRSYDLIAAQCGTTAQTLEGYAKIRRLKPNCKIYQHINNYATKSSGGVNVGIKNIYKISRRSIDNRFYNFDYDEILLYR